MAEERKEKKPRIVFWSILGVGLWYMYNNIFIKE
tara:strand:+ start:255 stop:356 length:102 start_codon:yes stop_codon:yes gene_type:complete